MANETTCTENIYYINYPTCVGSNISIEVCTISWNGDYVQHIHFLGVEPSGEEPLYLKVFYCTSSLSAP